MSYAGYQITLPGEAPRRSPADTLDMNATYITLPDGHKARVLKDDGSTLTVLVARFTQMHGLVPRIEQVAK